MERAQAILRETAGLNSICGGADNNALEHSWLQLPPRKCPVLDQLVGAVPATHVGCWKVSSEYLQKSKLGFPFVGAMLEEQRGTEHGQ